MDAADRKATEYFLIEDDIAKFILDASNDDFELLAHYLEFGFAGYTNFTDEELLLEFTERQSNKEEA